MGSKFSSSSDGAMAAIPAMHFVRQANRQLPPFADGLAKCVFAAGCFWGTEKRFWRMPGVYSTSVGYIAGDTKDPSYEQVCSGRSGHTEACQVVYDPEQISIVDLLRMHWECHDPTQGNRQGNDSGTQYRSGVYPDTPEQHKIAAASKVAYEKLLGRPITTEMGEPGQHPYYYAEEYHQQYLAKPGARPYCSAQPTGAPLPPYPEWAPAGMEAHAPKLGDEYWSKYAPAVEPILRAQNQPVDSKM